MDLKGAEIRNFYGVVLGKNDPTSDDRNVISIPHFQRPYRWGVDLVEQLLKDWNQQSSSYFAGSIVTVIKNFSDNANNANNVNNATKFELIDGQQRFTTIYLVNFVRFLLYRAMVRECCVEKKLVMGHNEFLNALSNAQSYFLKSNDSLKGYAEKIKKMDANEDYEKLYREYAYFPTNCWENDPEYEDEHYKKLKEYLEKSEFLLAYDRSFFNSVLLEVLSSVYIKISNRQEPELVIRDFDDGVLNDAGKNYSDAIRKIFDYFLKIVVKNDTNSFDVALEMTEKMSDFLRQIQICVIETGNPDDAYTLFETLNERSLALGNLDLIKNLFFKTFVESNKNMPEQQKDSHIQELDNFWNDEIFKGTGSKEKDLITFLAITYITGNDKITLKQSDKTVRSALKERNQESFKGLNPYTFELAQKDFNVFKACKILLDAAEVRYNSVANAAFEESYGNGSLYVNIDLSHLILR